MSSVSSSKATTRHASLAVGIGMTLAACGNPTNTAAIVVANNEASASCVASPGDLDEGKLKGVFSRMAEDPRFRKGWAPAAIVLQGGGETPKCVLWRDLEIRGTQGLKANLLRSNVAGFIDTNQAELQKLKDKDALRFAGNATSFGYGAPYYFIVSPPEAGGGVLKVLGEYQDGDIAVAMTLEANFAPGLNRKKMLRDGSVHEVLLYIGDVKSTDGASTASPASASGAATAENPAASTPAGAAVGTGSGSGSAS